MPPKAKTPAPIDRPLSRAYLREFTGWSTEYPPGMSDPTSLREMENVLINRDGSCRVRPGLRYMSYTSLPDGVDDLGVGLVDLQMVGSHEAFFLNDGSKAYLFAVRELNGTVTFRVLRIDELGSNVFGLTDPGVEFTIPQGEPALTFTSATTYVKYLQVDNKIFVLSNAGEPLRIFYVGEDKIAKRIISVEKPDFTVTDQLTVVHPDEGWITDGIITTTRLNRLLDPAFSNGAGWTVSSNGVLDIGNHGVSVSGVNSAAVMSAATETNLVNAPLSDVATYGLAGWSDESTKGVLSVDGSYLQWSVTNGLAGSTYFFRHVDSIEVLAGKTYTITMDYGSITAGLDVEISRSYYTAAGVKIGSTIYYMDTSPTSGERKVFPSFTPPAGCVKMVLRVGAAPTSDHVSARNLRIRRVRVSLATEPTADLHGDMGGDYHWLGTANESKTVYHPPVDVTLISNKLAIEPSQSIASSISSRATVGSLKFKVGTIWYDATDAEIARSLSADLTPDTAAWNIRSEIDSAPPGATQAALIVEMDDLPYGAIHYLDNGLSEVETSLEPWFNGSTADTGTITYEWTGAADGSTSTSVEVTSATAIPTPETPTTNTLISSTAADNDYSMGFFYLFTNEVGDSAPSQVTVVKMKRPWSGWLYQTPNASGEPSGTPTFDPTQVADQLVAYMPEAVFDAAIAQGALSWSLYVMSWSDQDSVPVEAVKVEEIELSATSLYDSKGWARVTPRSAGASDDILNLPSEENRYNYSDPSKASNGLVAADRMILVRDPSAAAVIRWSSNRQGEYTNFTANIGGGYKTLTSGNLMVPACVKLWQNPQSVDTLTILCEGTDGYNTAYYMAPATVTSQSDNSLIMGFEETTATPGTVSPYGVEVFNNALFHPIDDQLMKSTASNYNINHKSMTDQIQTTWEQLNHKEDIISSQHDGRIYYIVNNPEGEELEDGQNGNEIWVLDAAAETPTWSRWLIQAHSLRKIEYAGKIVMSVIRADGIYYLDEDSSTDSYTEDGDILERFIPWKLVSNTQGANRAHDAWCHLQQAAITLGMFTGTVRWGIRGWDIDGKAIDRNKITRYLDEVPDGEAPWDLEDQLNIARKMQQWFFYAESVTDDDDLVLQSHGQISNVQYRYAPVSVNVGYEYGSVETFEYGRATDNWLQRTTDNGVPIPVNDQRRP